MVYLLIVYVVAHQLIYLPFRLLQNNELTDKAIEGTLNGKIDRNLISSVGFPVFD